MTAAAAAAVPTDPAPVAPVAPVAPAAAVIAATPSVDDDATAAANIYLSMDAAAADSAAPDPAPDAPVDPADVLVNPAAVPDNPAALFFLATTTPTAPTAFAAFDDRVMIGILFLMKYVFSRRRHENTYFIHDFFIFNHTIVASQERKIEIVKCFYLL
jgi:hypothetical protein